MTAGLPFIHTQAELLDLMRQHPATREARNSGYSDLRGNPIRAVAEGDAIVSLVAVNSDADLLLDAVMMADPDSRAWERLPLRYNPLEGACLLPDHPAYPRFTPAMPQRGGL